MSIENESDAETGITTIVPPAPSGSAAPSQSHVSAVAGSGFAKARGTPGKGATISQHLAHLESRISTLEDRSNEHDARFEKMQRAAEAARGSDRTEYDKRFRSLERACCAPSQ